MTAVSHELKPYLDICEDREIVKIGQVEYTLATLRGKRVAMIVAGIGAVCAGSVMTHLIKSFEPAGIICSGTAGGIAPDLHLGDVVIGSTAFEVEMFDLVRLCQGTPFADDLVHSFKREVQPAIFHADVSMMKVAVQVMPEFSGLAMKDAKRIPAKAVVGKLASSDSFPLNREHFPLLREHNVSSLSMEDSAVYQTSWLFGTPSLCVRGISNMIHDADTANVDTAEVHLASQNVAEMVGRILLAL